MHHDILRPYPDQSFTNTDNQHAIGIGDTVRIIGCSDHKHNGTEAVIQQWSNTRGRWIVYSVATKHDTPRYHLAVLQREYNSSPSPPYDHQRHLRPRQRSSVNGPKTRQQRPRLCRLPSSTRLGGVAVESLRVWHLNLNEAHTNRGPLWTNTPGTRPGSLLGSHERDESRGTVSMAKAPLLDTVWFVGFVCPPCLRSGTKCNYEGITLFSSGVDPYQPDPGIL